MADSCPKCGAAAEKVWPTHTRFACGRLSNEPDDQEEPRQCLRNQLVARDKEIEKLLEAADGWQEKCEQAERERDEANLRTTEARRWARAFFRGDHPIKEPFEGQPGWLTDDNDNQGETK